MNNKVLMKLHEVNEISWLSFEFPKGFPLKKHLIDIMDSNVDEKYYLSDVYHKRFYNSLNNPHYPFGKTTVVVGSTVGTGKGANIRHWTYDPRYCSPALNATMYKQPHQVVVL